MKQIAQRTVVSESQFIIDTPSRADAQLAQLAASGRLDAKAQARPFGDRGEVMIPVWVFPEREQPEKHLSSRTVAIAAGSAVALGGVLFVGWEVFEFVIHYWAYIAGVVVAILIAAAWLTLRSGPTCEGVHFRH